MVGGDFDCKENESLKSLKGKPKKIGGEFKCDDEVLIWCNKNDENGKNIFTKFGRERY